MLKQAGEGVVCLLVTHIVSKDPKASLLLRTGACPQPRGLQVLWEEALPRLLCVSSEEIYCLNLILTSRACPHVHMSTCPHDSSKVKLTS